MKLQTALEILQVLDNIEVTLSVVNDNIRYSPRAPVDSRPDLRARMVENKDDLIYVLSSGSTILAPQLDGAGTSQKNDDLLAPQLRSGSTIPGGEELVSPADGSSQEDAEPDPETESLVRWFLDEGQHLLPSEPFRLTRNIRVTNPARFKEHLHFCISQGPEGFHYRNGYLKRDLRWLRKTLPDAKSLDEYEERKAIMIVDGGLSEEEASIEAYKDIHIDQSLKKEFS